MYTRIEQMDNKNYEIYFTDKFYENFYPYYNGSSYFNILYRLFGLLPRDFYHMVGASYHAIYVPSRFIKNFIHMQFQNKTDAANFCREVDHRIQYILTK